MKIMVIDDEVLVRVGIKTIIPWEDYGHTIVGEAGNGAEALDVFRETRPDITLVDIRMPEMDGLEFISKINHGNIRSKFIILTCLNEMKYVKEAMKLGVRDYIIKTAIDSNELLRIISDLSEEIENERIASTLSQVAENDKPVNSIMKIRQLLPQENADPSKLADLIRECDPELVSPQTYVLSLRILHFDSLRKRLEGQSEEVCSRAIRNICTEVFKTFCRAGIIYEEGGKYFCAVVSLVRCDKERAGILNELCIKIIETIKMLLSIEVEMGVGGEIKRDEDLGRAYREAIQSRERLFFMEKQYCIFEGSPVDPNRSASFKSEIRLLSNEIFYSITNLNFAGILELNDRIKSKLAVGYALVDVNEAREIYLDIYFWQMTQIKKDLSELCQTNNVFSGYLQNLQTAENIGELHGVIVDFVRGLRNAVVERYGNRLKTIVNHSKAFILQNISRDISMVEVANHAGLSAGYFSKVFKKESGINFTDFIISCRIDQAKQLIKSCDKLQTVAMQVGYPDLSSFSRTFKKVTGISPSEYKGRFL